MLCCVVLWVWMYVFVRVAAQHRVNASFLPQPSVSPPPPSFCHHPQPNEVITILGSHEDFPVEEITVTAGARYLASCSHDESIQFWYGSLASSAGEGRDHRMSRWKGGGVQGIR